MTRTLSILTVIALAAVGCTGTTSEDAALEPVIGAETLPAVEPTLPDTGPEPFSNGDQPAAAMAVVDTDGQFAVVDDNGAVTDTWIKWSTMVAPDATQAVLTLRPKTVRTLTSTKIAWVLLPDGEQKGGLDIEGIIAEATATSLDGELVALTTLAEEPTDDAIAGARDGTNIVIASREAGVLFKTSLDGNFMAEAFSQQLTAQGVPAQVFLLEYLPAEAPTYYQVRVLATETGEVSPPLNLRDKSQTLDQQMAGYSRSHVVANDHGLLFTLYIGTDQPDETHPHAFVHTLDFTDGVWCLDIDPKLDLTHVAGSLAVGGSPLYVASANGWVGSFLISSITNPNQAPTMDWTAQITAPGPAAPVITADENGVYIGSGENNYELVHLRPNGTEAAPIPLPGQSPQALFMAPNGDVVAVGADWTTLTDTFQRPEWLDDISQLIIVPEPTE
ncbi:MAG: hypothetical protein ACJAR2_001881 [Ilumatobacter sp.]